MNDSKVFISLVPLKSDTDSTPAPFEILGLTTGDLPYRERGDSVLFGKSRGTYDQQEHHTPLSSLGTIVFKKSHFESVGERRENYL